MSADPFQVLLDIERAYRQNAKPLPRAKMPGRIWQGVGFISGKMNLVTPLSEIVEVLPIPKTTPLPAALPWFRGVANLRGRVLPITDLQGFIVGHHTVISEFSRVLVIEFDQTGVGFLVDRVIGVQRFYEDSLKTKVDKGFSEELNTHIQGEFQEEKNTWKVISLKGLSQSTQFFHIVKELGA